MAARPLGAVRNASPASGRGALLVVLIAIVAAGCAGTADTAARHDRPARGEHRALSMATRTPSPRESATAPRSRHQRKQRRTHHAAVKPALMAGVPAKDMPDRSLTPGRTFRVGPAAICVSGYSSRVRDVPDSEKEAVYARYGVVHTPYTHEVDHLVSLELGGSNAIENLWPEPYAGRWGARTKDVLENRLHDLVCSGALQLRRAQHIEATNWVLAYKKYVGTPPAAHTSSSRPARKQRATTGSGGSGSGSCEPGYSPCLPRAYDLDCGDISSSKKPIRVTGSDPYRLDADGDGWACEP